MAAIQVSLKVGVISESGVQGCVGVMRDTLLPKLSPLLTPCLVPLPTEIGLGPSLSPDVNLGEVECRG